MCSNFCFDANKAYKNGKYAIYPEGKIFGEHIRYIKIRRAVTPEWLTIWQSESFTKERNTLIMNMPGGLPWT